MINIDYNRRITAVEEALGKGAMVLMAQPEAVRNADTDHPYRQDSSLYYLTGVAEPETILMLTPYRDEGDRSHLFVRPRDAHSELWDGKRLGVEGAQKQLPFDKVHTVAEFPELAPMLRFFRYQ